MTVKLLAFSRCVEAVGAPVISWDVVEGTTVEGLLSNLIERYPKLSGMKVVIAVNQEVALSNVIIQAQDEIALLPPVSGG